MFEQLHEKSEEEVKAREEEVDKLESDLKRAKNKLATARKEKERYSKLSDGVSWFERIRKIHCKKCPDIDYEYVKFDEKTGKVSYVKNGLNLMHFGRLTWCLDDYDYFCDGWFKYKGKTIVTMKDNKMFTAKGERI